MFMANDTFMEDGARYQSGKGPAFERRAFSFATSTAARRRSSPADTRVPSIRAASLSLPRESISARSAGRNSRDHNTGHFEASATNRRTSPEIREKQRSDDWGNRNRRLACLSAYSQKAWLSRIPEATLFESISHMHLIVCWRRRSRRLTRFWSHVGNALSAYAGRS